MSNIDIQKHPETHSMTVASEWPAPIEQVWQLWADPRKLERWWGPPMYPATVTQHDLQPGGKVKYYMTSPEGDRYGGYWLVGEVDAPNRFTFLDGFADAEGNVNDELPATQTVVTFTDLGGGITRMVMESTFPSLEAMEQMVAMGMEEGLRGAMGQIGSILAEVDTAESQ